MPPPEHLDRGLRPDLERAPPPHGGESTISRSDQPDPTYERRYSRHLRLRARGREQPRPQPPARPRRPARSPTRARPVPDLASYRMTESTMTLRDNTAPTAANRERRPRREPRRGAARCRWPSAPPTRGSGVYRIDRQRRRAGCARRRRRRQRRALRRRRRHQRRRARVPLACAVQGQRRPAAGASTPAGCRSAPTPSRSCSRTRPATARRSTWPVAKTILAPPAGRGADATGRRPATPPASRARRNRSVHDLVRPPPAARQAAGSSVPTASRSPARGSTCSRQLHRAGSRFRAHRARRAPAATRRVQLQGTAGRVADAALRLPLPSRRRCLSPPRSTCCSACAPSATLRASQRFVARGGRVTFRGRVRGGYVPPRGKLGRTAGDRPRALADVRAHPLEPPRRLPLPLPLLGLGPLRVSCSRALRARLPLRARLQPAHVRSALAETPYVRWGGAFSRPGATLPPVDQ